MISIILPYHKVGVGADGPLQSIIGVCDFLKDNYKYQIITQCNDFKNTAVEDSIAKHRVVLIPKFNTRILLAIINSSEVIWINSIYSIPFSLIPLILTLFSKKKILLISTRGQLLEGSLNFKKELYLRLYKRLLKTSGNSIYVHYSSEEEKLKSYPIFKNYRSLLFNNSLKNTFTKEPEHQQKSSQYVIGYLGRVAPIKNIEFIISIMPQLPHYMVFHIYGIVVNKTYKRKLEKMILQLDLEKRVVFKGEYAYKELKDIYTHIDIAVVPSKSESFCYSFFEAIENNTPVLGSSGLPWKTANGFQPQTILALDKEKWIKQILHIASRSYGTLGSRQQNLEYFYKKIIKSVKKNTLRSFENLTY
ncbi:glycosyltransferase [Marixanthomonas spongiae]|uniref:Glycosyl transferase family 1 domain-containing protein n=1 Tax=Marixanthomonas spongiae TaxID=2174845 RepID=A0A2U0I3T7_9FLAO|nr:glycosyltransferase [Marixanthomonas spongiae]PVW15759.1 hypothetical protein DDV96_05685 [Marixanthomonas spongiae]